jgi:hypothetical protein
MTLNHGALDLDRVPYDQLIPRRQITSEWKRGNSFTARSSRIGPVSIFRANELVARG